MRPDLQFLSMRSFLAGFFSLLLGLSPFALGQIDERNSFVESIGFSRAYRADAWVPMVVNLTSTLGEAAEYQVQVVQPDVDGDRVIYSRLITLNPNVAQKYWVYFRPQPTGLDAATTAELQRMLRVRVCTRDGKELMILPLTTTLADIDPKTGFGVRRGTKLVLAVTAGGATPATNDYDPQTAYGLIEDVAFLKVDPGMLPESAIGYEMVDAVVWFDANAAELTASGSRKLQAMQEWVRQGGQLVVCHPDESYRIEPFADMLPVHLKGLDNKPVVDVKPRGDIEPLHRLATEPLKLAAGGERAKQILDRWPNMLLQGPFRVARAPFKGDAVVEEWIDWSDAEGGGRSPYIARNAYGLGAVTWVAQDLGDRILTGPLSSGWPHVWDKVFGWKNNTVLIKPANQQQRTQVWGKELDDWGAGLVVDLGGVFLGATDHKGKAGAYVFLVILFFVGYWIIAGPGSYLFLAGKGQRQLSWAIFALAGLAATVFTVGVVKVVLRGEPEVKHVSIVRFAAGLPTVVDSRIGLYIPRDGRETIALKDVAPDAASYITPLAIHPQHLGNPATFSDTKEYVIPVRDVSGTEPVEAEVHYRNTLKKLQAHWVGTLAEGITGTAGLVAQRSVDIGAKDNAGVIEGRLTNKTGHDLKHVLFGFRFQEADADGAVQDQDMVLYVPSWKKDQTIDLLRTFAQAEILSDLQKTTDKYVQGTADKPIWGPLAGPNSWGELWLKYMKTLAGNDGLVNDSGRSVTQSVAVMTFYDRIPPLKNAPYLNYARAELMRRGGRPLNLSHALAAGNLIILAEVRDAPLPFPLEVEGSRMTGQGTVHYQASLPLKNRSALMEPFLTAPRPETQPAADQTVERVVQ